MPDSQAHQGIPPRRIINLDGLSLPAEHPQSRQLPFTMRKLADRPEIKAGYDTKTLVYAAIAFPSRNRVHLYTPRLFNLRSVLSGGQFRLGGIRLPQGVPFKLLRHERHVLNLLPQALGDRLEFCGAGINASMSLFTADTVSFSGRNVLYTMQHDNDLEWIRDWAEYHASAHGADAVIIADNGSKRYSAETLYDVLADVKGISQVAVLRVPFLFGVAQGFRNLSYGRFLQKAMVNVVRDMFLTTARAVLPIDIDELVIARRGGSIFDAVTKSRFGFLTFPGFNRRSNPAYGRPTHRNSIYILNGPKASNLSPTKYAVVPGTIAGRSPWGVHSLELLPRTFFLSRDFWFAHCLDVTTNWRGKRSLDHLPPDSLVDEPLERVLSRHLSPELKGNSFH